MQNLPPHEPQGDGKARAVYLQPGQTVVFIGDHTSRDDPGYVGVVADVLSRFYPRMQINLGSVGAQGQTATGLQAALPALISSRPDWLVIGIGLTDAMREPVARTLLEEYRQRLAEIEDEGELALGPEYRIDPRDLGPRSDVGAPPELKLERLETFTHEYRAAVNLLRENSVNCLLLTTILVGNDLQNPVNAVVKAYNRAIREAASESGELLVDIERSFRDLFDRASNYKQKVSLTGPDGSLNPQGQALLARTLLGTLSLLPPPGFRPRP
ncbi:MAG: GDSL-type esterase/lipase family protein [Chloroflexota bacterium]|nr:GDSL-type esterase/lipase family protein [Chloroflexota bacterium]